MNTNLIKDLKAAEKLAKKLNSKIRDTFKVSSKSVKAA